MEGVKGLFLSLSEEQEQQLKFLLEDNYTRGRQGIPSTLKPVIQRNRQIGILRERVNNEALKFILDQQNPEIINQVLSLGELQLNPGDRDLVEQVLDGTKVLIEMLRM